jgi:hypothetical protein
MGMPESEVHLITIMCILSLTLLEEEREGKDDLCERNNLENTYLIQRLHLCNDYHNSEFVVTLKQCHNIRIPRFSESSEDNLGNLFYKNRVSPVGKC